LVDQAVKTILVGVGVGSTTLGASTTAEGDGVGVGLTTAVLITGFLTTGFLATGFLATDLAAGFLGAEKEGAGISNVNESAKTMYFFMMPFSRFLLSCTMESKESTLSLSPLSAPEFDYTKAT
jgi:hypothetical protein